MKVEQNQDFDFNMDFSGGGEVASLDSFLEDDDKPKPDPTDTDEKDSIEDKINNDEVIIDPRKEVDNNGDKGGGEENNGVEQIDTEEDVSVGGTNYKKVLEVLVSTGVLDDDIVVETEEGEKPLSELDLDGESLAEIIKQKIEQVKEEAIADKIDAKGVSDFTKKLIEIEKNGGNVKQAVETYEKIQSPLDSIDLSTKEGQAQAVYMKYKAKGLEDTDINRIIKGFLAEGVLEEEGKKADSELREAVAKQLEALEKSAIEKQKKVEEEIKRYKKDLSKVLSDKFDLKDSFKKKIVELSVKRDETGRFELDKLYSEFRKDPEKAAELALFLTDKEAYKKHITSVEVNKKQVDTFKKFKLVKRGGSSVKISGSKENKSEEDIDFNEFINKVK